ncbi:MAG: hypothetical protein FJ316_06610 [SAR202 cluster bacterium]|nr:hypothetical protein [SAR202 cluster bacterium]
MPLTAVAFFVAALLFYYRGVYTAPAIPAPSPYDIQSPVLEYAAPAPELSKAAHGRAVVFDASHRNRFSPREISVLTSQIASRGYTVQIAGNFSSLSTAEHTKILESALREANSLVVISPNAAYTPEEVTLVRQFVERGGRLLLIGDPTRENQINSLADAFGIYFRSDYLYSLSDYQLNYQYIRIRDFRPDEITQGLQQISLYSASSIISDGPGLAVASDITRSSLVHQPGPYYPLVRSAAGQVVAISDSTFMVPPQDKVADNGRLVSNLASYLTQPSRRYTLSDFPEFFQGDPQVLLAQPELFADGRKLQGILTDLGVVSQMRGTEDPSRDMVFLGLFEDAPRVAQYLEPAGVRIGTHVTTPAGAFPRQEMAVLVLYRSQGRHVLVGLADTPDILSNLVDSLRPNSDFRQGVVDELVGVYPR